ncbi:MAG: hypothetical protein CEN90_749 [Parcubacteria group bacterium Licking1014_17]|nr:MAG: hypothetical protein CEN90_749 [Parcubacteria group bacterium Licking1014_17]
MNGDERDMRKELEELLKGIIRKHPLGVLGYLAVLSQEFHKACDEEAKLLKVSVDSSKLDDDGRVLAIGARIVSLSTLQEIVGKNKKTYWDTVRVLHDLGHRGIPDSSKYFLTSEWGKGFLVTKLDLEQKVFEEIKTVGLYRKVSSI